MKSHFNYSYIVPSLWVLFLLSNSCISPADIDLGEVNPSLVVEGFITDQAGPHEIIISRVAPFAGVLQGGIIERIKDAEVSLIDDLGNVTPLETVNLIKKEVFNSNPMGCSPAVTFVEGPSDFRTPEGFRGVVGRTYTLQIIVEGNTYQSTPQLMLATPVIDTIGLNFTEVPSTNELTPRSGVEVSATWQDPPGNTFYSWRLNGIYRINTQDRFSSSSICCLFDPVDNGASDCWIRETDVEGNVLSLSDRFFEAQRRTEIVGFIEDDGLRFANRDIIPSRQYYVQVEQYQLSQEAFEFFDRVGVLATINGEIFDPPPLSIRGNISNVNNPDERVIGFFGAYSVQTKDTFIPLDLLESIQTFPNPCGDCRVRPGAQVELPEEFR